jgi:crotonobetainyl-CoA:carnitine CoA-transferase CaiB-like acyl-CoA transferase
MVGGQLDEDEMSTMASSPSKDNAMRPSHRALEGVRVVDLSRLLPGAFCSQILADLGADVIKVEEPGRGDYQRAFKPLAKEESGSFLLLNRNKRSITLNLKAPGGKEVLQRMTRDADVLLESFRPGVMNRLGLDYETLSAENPGLIYCAITGFGQDGPYRSVPGHDLNYLAIAGILPLFAEAGRSPIVPGLSIADVGGGSLMAVSGIMAALLARAKTGRGQFVDISMTDGAVSWLSFHGAEYLFGGTEPRGGERPFIGQAPCYNIYQCSDGRYVALGIIEDFFWRRFCEAVGLLEYIDQQWPEGPEAAAQLGALRALFATLPQREWLSRMKEHDIPFSPVNGIGDALEDPQIQHRQMLLHVDHPVEGQIPQLGFPIKLSDTPCDIRTAPPVLGEHTREILADLGYETEEISELERSGAV